MLLLSIANWELLQFRISFIHSLLCAARTLQAFSLGLVTKGKSLFQTNEEIDEKKTSHKSFSISVGPSFCMRSADNTPKIWVILNITKQQLLAPHTRQNLTLGDIGFGGLAMSVAIRILKLSTRVKILSWAQNSAKSMKILHNKDCRCTNWKV